MCARTRTHASTPLPWHACANTFGLHAHVRKHAHTHTHTYTHKPPHKRTHTRTPLCTHKHSTCMHARMRARRHIRMRTVLHLGKVTGTPTPTPSPELPPFWLLQTHNPSQSCPNETRLSNATDNAGVAFSNLMPDPLSGKHVHLDVLRGALRHPPASDVRM
jgi:hypothetical protein